MTLLQRQWRWQKRCYNIKFVVYTLQHTYIVKRTDIVSLYMSGWRWFTDKWLNLKLKVESEAAKSKYINQGKTVDNDKKGREEF